MTAARTHPPSLFSLLKKTLSGPCGIGPGAPIAVGVSGGPDSMALLHALTLCREQLDLNLLAVSIDHGLRPEAEQEVGLVQAFCQKHQVPFVGAALCLSPGANLHARAREARYERLWSVADQRLGKNCFLATAHHKNDRAETVLLRLLRGSSLSGLGVLLPRQDRLLRPLIYATRKDVELHVERHGVPFVVDPSNRDTKYLRTKVRTELLPLLEQLGPGVTDHLAALADEAAELPEALGLSREHRVQLKKAALNPRLPIDLRLPGGLRLTRVKNGPG